MHNNLTYQINGCLFTVFNQLKNLWNEKVYEEMARTIEIDTSIIV